MAETEEHKRREIRGTKAKKETQETQSIQQEPTQIHYKTINVHFV